MAGLTPDQAQAVSRLSAFNQWLAPQAAQWQMQAAQQQALRAEQAQAAQQQALQAQTYFMSRMWQPPTVAPAARIGPTTTNCLPNPGVGGFSCSTW
jgi:hypothetical protein